MLIQVLGTVAITDSGVAVSLPGAILARILALLTPNLDGSSPGRLDRWGVG